MTDRLSDAALVELEQLLQAATPGPWTYEEDNGSPGSCSAADADVGVFASGEPVMLGDVLQCDNLKFVVATRNALPALLAELRERRALDEK